MNEERQFCEYNEWCKVYDPDCYVKEKEPPTEEEIEAKREKKQWAVGKVIDFATPRMEGSTLKLFLETIGKVCFAGEGVIEDKNMGEFLNAFSGFAHSYRFEHVDPEKWGKRMEYFRKVSVDKMFVAFRKLVDQVHIDARSSGLVKDADVPPLEKEWDEKSIKSASLMLKTKLCSVIDEQKGVAVEMMDTSKMFEMLSVSSPVKLDEGVKELIEFIRTFALSKLDQVIALGKLKIEECLGVLEVMSGTLAKALPESKVTEGEAKARVLAELNKAYASLAAGVHRYIQSLMKYLETLLVES
mmetsp:Transcript_28087/g.45052  ORF Transcript_28087/g.45052 Transcript_28087/m.45052 type:complete len:300 (+) Transcript_28087:282-1181(+)